MFNKDYAQEFLVTFMKVGYSLSGAQKSLKYLYESLQEANGAIDYSKPHFQTAPKDPAYKYNAIIDRIVTREHELIELMDKYATLGIMVEDSLLKMDLPEKYMVIPDILRDKYVLRLSDKEIQKKYGQDGKPIPKTTYWRYLNIGYEHFDVPEVDWTEFIT